MGRDEALWYEVCWLWEEAFVAVDQVGCGPHMGAFHGEVLAGFRIDDEGFVLGDGVFAIDLAES